MSLPSFKKGTIGQTTVKSKLMLSEIDHKERTLSVAIAEIGGESLSGTGASHDMRPDGW